MSETGGGSLRVQCEQQRSGAGQKGGEGCDNTRVCTISCVCVCVCVCVCGGGAAGTLEGQ